MHLNTNSPTNICPRCGKPRIDGKTWTEEITTLAGISVVTHTMTICPDSDCQKVVDAKWAEQIDKSNKIKAEFDARALAKKKAREDLKKTKNK